MNRPRPRHGATPNSEMRGKKGAGEVAGGTAAECTAVLCCLPCTVMDTVVLVVYRVPVGLCRKAIRTCKAKRQPQTAKMNGDVLLKERRGAPSCCVGSTLEDQLALEVEKEERKDVWEFGRMDELNWARFNVTGFWGSHSRRLRSSKTGLELT